MGLGLELRAGARGAEVLSVVERFIAAQCGELVEHLTREPEALGVGLHPAAEDVSFCFEGGALCLSAKTSTVGPGYHAFVCDLAHRLEPVLGAPWRGPGDDEPIGDETGYFQSGDRAALEAELLRWVRGLCDVVAERVAEGASGLLVSLPTDAQYEFDGVMATPMGPRDAAWLSEVLRRPERGMDLFPWWEPGLGAGHARGRALARMWTEVRWRAPMTEAERRTLALVDADLRRAHRLASGGELPWAEWAELVRWLGLEDPVAREVLARGQALRPAIGYRRRPVRVSLPGGWSVRVPGEMATQLDDDGTWSASSPGRTVWMSSFRVGDPEAKPLSAEATLPTRAREGEPFAIEVPPGQAGRASRVSETDGTTVTLELAVPNRLAVFTVALDDGDDLPFVRALASSVHHG